MTHLIDSLHLALPQVVLLGMTCVTILLSVFKQHRCDEWCYGLAQFSLAATLGLLWVAPHGSAFAGMMVIDHFSRLLDAACVLSMMLIFAYSRQYLRQHQMPAPEFYLLSLFATLGMMVLISAPHLLTIYLGLELMSLPIYALVALRRDEPICAEAALKYFITGSLASGMLLYGFSMLFGATGSLALIDVAQAVNGGLAAADHPQLLALGAVFSVVGLAFKLGAVPFHMWVPDVYEGAPTPVTLMIASAPKLAVFAMLYRIFADGLGGLVTQWQPMLMMIALLSMMVGNVLALVQQNLKRMLAYSSIGHMGYLLLGALVATVQGWQAATFYILTYVLTTLGAFGVLLQSKHGCEQISDLAGLNNRHPGLAFLMLLAMFSMAGVPPLVGFIAKFGLFKAVMHQHLTWLAIVAMVFAVVGAYYYIRVVKVMYFASEADSGVALEPKRGQAVLLTLNNLAVLCLGIMPAGLLAIVRHL